MSEYLFEVDQGCDFELELELVQDDGITPFPLTAYSSITCDYGDRKTLVKIGSFAASIVDPFAGKVKLTLTAIQTDALTPSTHLKYGAQLRAFTPDEPPLVAPLLDMAFTVKGEFR